MLSSSSGRTVAPRSTRTTGSRLLRAHYRRPIRAMPSERRDSVDPVGDSCDHRHSQGEEGGPMLFADGVAGLLLGGLWLFCIIDVVKTPESPDPEPTQDRLAVCG